MIAESKVDVNSTITLKPWVEKKSSIHFNLLVGIHCPLGIERHEIEQLLLWASVPLT